MIKHQTITDQIEQGSNGKLKRVPEYSKLLWSMFNDGGVETEVGEFLYALTRMLKPARILETGTHLGVSAAYFGRALADNVQESSLVRGCKIETIEFLPENHEAAGSLIRELGLNEFVKLHLMDAKDFKPTGEYDIIFLDTEPQTRFAELLKFFPYLKPGGIVMIHDLHPHMHQVPNEEHGFAWPYGVIPKEMKALFKEDKLRLVHFRTPRGFTMMYKPDVGDYSWQ